MYIISRPHILRYFPIFGMMLFYDCSQIFRGFFVVFRILSNGYNIPYHLLDIYGILKTSIHILNSDTFRSYVSYRPIFSTFRGSLFENFPNTILIVRFFYVLCIFYSRQRQGKMAARAFKILLEDLSWWEE